MEIPDDRLYKPPQWPTIPKTNHVNKNLDGDTELDREEESQSDDYQYDFIDDNIEYDMYEGEETLPPPEVSSIRTRELEEPKVNLG